MSARQVLLVEGADDQHVIWSLLEARSFPESFKVQSKDGIDNILKILPVQLKGSAVSTVGVVVDADLDIQAQWSRIRAILTNAGYDPVPAAPDRSGTIVSRAGGPKVGVWLMPDNVLAGMLEDFVAYLVPPADPGFAHAGTVLGELPDAARKFAPAHLSKAHIHTWLAWQTDPGTPMGLAVTKKYLDAHSPSAAPFIQWLTALFI